MSETFFHEVTKPMRIAVLISGTGTNMVAIMKAIEAGELDATIPLVVSSNGRAKGITTAREAGYEVLVFEPSDYADPQAVDAKMVEAFKAARIDYVVMAGYMRMVTPVLLDAYPNRVVNLHPALLPKHPGAHGIQDAFDAGDKETGITIHFANEIYDDGPIIFQHVVPILDDDTVDELETRIHAAEHANYPKVLQMLAENRVKVVDGVCEIEA
jgi:phosphoribosylglycinamide formyltransferase-1